jgi:hypothetical protein
MDRDYDPDLPEMCYTVQESTGRVILITRGEEGYKDTNFEYRSKENSRVLADLYNQKLGVTKAQERAMSFGSVFGFDQLGASPKVWERKEEK